MERILVTGGAGYIGSHTCVELLDAGYDIVVADDLRNSKAEAIRRVKVIAGRDFPFVCMDVTDKAAMETLFGQYAFDAVIHFAGLKAVGESVEKPLAYYRNNLDATLTLLECMDRHNVRRLIFSSSATVYGMPERVPITEDMPTGCTNPYGWTKYISEQIMRDYAQANPGASMLLLRYFNPVGAHESGMLGEDPRDIPNNIMPFITRVVAGDYPCLHVFGHDYDTKDGTGVRDYIHVVDLARGHIAALRYSADHTGAMAVNLGTGTGYSVLELADAYERVNNVKVPREFAPRRPGDVAACYADTHRAEELLHWRATHDLADICRSAQKWLAQNPHGYEEQGPSENS